MTGGDVVLVTGASGKVGREVIAQLAPSGSASSRSASSRSASSCSGPSGSAVRALTRDPDGIRVPDSIEVVRGDLAEPGTLGPALEGVDTVFLVWPTLAADHAAASTLELIAKNARRVVYLSAHGVPEGAGDAAAADGDAGRGPASILGSHALIEHLIEASGLEWTILRPTGFAANTLGWADQIRRHGVVRWPYAQAARSLIHERDIAAVAAEVLTRDGYGRRKLVLSGPDTVTQADQVRIIGEATGRPARFEEITPEDARRELMAAWGVPAAVDAFLATWARFVTEPETITSGVRDVTGRPARTFGEWAVDHAADFR